MQDPADGLFDDTEEYVGSEEIDPALMDMDSSIDQMEMEGMPDGAAGEGDFVPQPPVSRRGTALAKASKQAEEILQQAQEEAQNLMASARQEIEDLKAQALEQARAEGYESGARQGLENGMAQAEEELAGRRAELEQEFKEKSESLEAEYDALVSRLEPEFVDKLSSIYEHIFRVDLSSHKDVVVHLIRMTLHGIEPSRHYIVRVSKEDYAFVNMQKKQIAEGMSNSTIEIVEDVTLRKSECMIDTDGGIFDCSLDTELAELTKRLKVLSYSSQGES
ncbi:MAG: hypothetical protein K5682_03450 [Lachnospiraceae bacterium]|nr:hypothetical protein [Lachnospiraceae bacterium]